MKPLELRLRERIDLIADERDTARAKLAETERQLKNALRREQRRPRAKTAQELVEARDRIRILDAALRREQRARENSDARRVAAEIERDKAKRRLASSRSRKLKVAA